MEPPPPNSFHEKKGKNITNYPPDFFVTQYSKKEKKIIHMLYKLYLMFCKFFYYCDLFFMNRIRNEQPLPTRRRTVFDAPNI